MHALADIRVAVLGTGSVGRRHAGNLKALGAQVRAWSRSPGRRFTLDDGSAIEATTDRDAVLRDAHAVVIATPTDEHIALARQAAAARKALFIEKPLSHDREGVAALRSEAQGLVVEIGCQLRGHPGLQRLKQALDSGESGAILTFRGCVGQRLDQWRPGTDYRASYSARRERGGGALSDLVHEVDLAHWLCGPMTGVFARLSQVSDHEMDADDLANLTLESATGACGSLQLDMLSPAYRRSFEVVCERAIYEWSYTAGTLVQTSAAGARVLHNAANMQRNELFRSHMEHFLARVLDPGMPARCPLDDGIACLDVLLAARASAGSEKWVRLEGRPS